MGDPTGLPEPSTVDVRVTTEPIRLCDCEGVPTPSDGALVVFSGVVRNETEGRSVIGLSYEAYKRLAETQMRDIARRAREAHGATAVRLVHRTGDLVVGEISVLAAVSAPHRQAAFDACRFCIDAIKQGAAIWKKELFADGTARWASHA